MSTNYSVDSRNIFVIKNISAEQLSLLSTIVVSNQNEVKVNILDISYSLNEYNSYNLYITVGIYNDEVITFEMGKQFEKNLYLMNIAYQIKKAVVVRNIETFDSLVWQNVL